MVQMNMEHVSKGDIKTQMQRTKYGHKGKKGWDKLGDWGLNMYKIGS